MVHPTKRGHRVGANLNELTESARAGLSFIAPGNRPNNPLNKLRAHFAYLPFRLSEHELTCVFLTLTYLIKVSPLTWKLNITNFENLYHKKHFSEISYYFF